DQVLWNAADEQIHLIRERVVFAQWAIDEKDKWFPRIVVASAGGKFEWIDRGERKPITAGRAYRWRDAIGLGEGIAVPTDRGVSIFTFAPEFKEDYHEILAADVKANPPQLVPDAAGLIAWSPWDGTNPGGSGAVRYADGKWRSE